MTKDGVAAAAAGGGRARGRRRDGTEGSELPQIALNKAKVVCVTVGDYIVISTRAERMAVMSGNKAEVGSMRRQTWQAAPPSRPARALYRHSALRIELGRESREEGHSLPAHASESLSVGRRSPNKSAGHEGVEWARKGLSVPESGNTERGGGGGCRMEAGGGGGRVCVSGGASGVDRLQMCLSDKLKGWGVFALQD